jgi:acetate kinase
MTRNRILTVNVGSSSLKLGLYEPENTTNLQCLSHASVDLAKSPPSLTIDGKRVPLNEILLSFSTTKSSLASLEQMALWILDRFGRSQIAAVGHRIVHGGTDFKSPIRITTEVIHHLEKLIPLAPLHEPASLDLIKTLRAALPDLPHVACFDTTFHTCQPVVASRFALPREFERQGIRRYGFHGLSYESIMNTLRKIAPELAEKRLIVAHLGSGASLSAIFQGKSIDTTMGFSALDGLPMATRCGSLDAGVILYLLQQEKMSFSELQDLLYHRSGLLGVSGISGDVRTLLASDTKEAKEALDLFVYRTAREMGGLITALGGLDGLVFTAGIGEHSDWIRQQVCSRLAWLGIDLDITLNQSDQPGCITTGKSTVQVWVIPTDEEGMIAHHTYKIIFL